MCKENETLIKDIIKSISGHKEVKTVILFGSVVRGQDKPASDIDICVVVGKRDRPSEKAISDSLLELEKRYNRDVQLIIADEEFKGIERQFLETILREGRVIAGTIPSIPIQKLQLEPYAIIKYEMKNLSHSDKMRLARLLYGKKTRKIYKGKTYISQKRGLLTQLKGTRAGRNSVLLPEKESWILEMKLSELGIRTKKVCAWLQKI